MGQILVITSDMADRLRECHLLDQIGVYKIVDETILRAVNILPIWPDLYEFTRVKENTDIISQLQKRYKRRPR